MALFYLPCIGEWCLFNTIIGANNWLHGQCLVLQKNFDSDFVLILNIIIRHLNFQQIISYLSLKLLSNLYGIFHGQNLGSV